MEEAVGQRQSAGNSGDHRQGTYKKPDACQDNFD
jgi:hypothetical protein